MKTILRKPITENHGLFFKRSFYRELLAGFILAGLLGPLITRAPAQVVLNEVLADNYSAVENGNDFPDYVELYNTSGQAVSLAGMSLTDDPTLPRAFVFPAGVTLAAHGYLVVWCDVNSGSPGHHSGFGLGAKGDRVRLYAANGSTVLDEIVFGLQLRDRAIGRVPNGSGVWTLTTPTARAGNQAASTAAAGQLRINEWMARPATGEDWIEIYNGANLPAAIGGLVITDSTGNAPTNRAIRALSFIGGRGFWQFFASNLKQKDVDHLDFKLSADGETLSILGNDRSTIIDRVTFGNQSDDVSEGRVPDGSDQVTTFPAGRATPGEANYGANTGVVVSEVLTHTDPPLEDAIELHNPTAAAVDISHWWLSDAASTPKKYRIPAGTIIAPGGFRVFYEYQFGAGASGFTLDSAEGDEVYLSAGNASGTLTGPQTVADFGPLKNGISAGRYQTSAGVDFVPLSRRTFGVDNPASNVQFRQGGGLPNALPLMGSVVINEIMFQPPAGEGWNSADDEFIELHNPTALPARLFDPLYPTNRWRLREGVSFDFPANQTLPAGGYLLLVGFDPETEPDQLAAFRAKYSVPAQVTILGPYSGKLADVGEALALSMPDEPQGPDKPDAGRVPYMLAERVAYAATEPWPAGAAGTGLSLQRQSALDYGNEPGNWMAASPTPGRANRQDSDQDGMPNGWETAHGLNPNSAADAAQDADGDGVNNLAEYRAGTDPQNQGSVFKIASYGVLNGKLNLKFTAAANRAYAVQVRDPAGSGSWQTWTNLQGSGELQVTLPPPAAPPAFYRLAIPTPP